MASKSKSSKSRRNTASRGFVNNTILECLLDGDKYGYEIIKEVKDKTDGKVVLKEPSLYSSLKRFEQKGYISSYWGDSDIGGRRHYYSLTEPGKKYYLSIKSPGSVELDLEDDIENDSNTVIETEQLTIENINEEIYNIENDVSEVDDNSYINNISFDVNDKLNALLNEDPPTSPTFTETTEVSADVFNEDVSVYNTTAETDIDAETEKELINEINSAIQKEQTIIDNLDANIEDTSIAQEEIIYDHKFRNDVKQELSSGSEKYVQYDLFSEAKDQTNYVDLEEVKPQVTTPIIEKEQISANNTEKEITKDIPLIEESEVSFFNWNEMKRKASSNKTSFSNKISTNTTTNKYELSSPTPTEEQNVKQEQLFDNSYKTKNDLHSLFNDSKASNSNKIIDNVTPNKVNNKIFDNVGHRINVNDAVIGVKQVYNDEPQMSEADYELLNRKLNEKFDSITENRTSTKKELDYKKILGDLYYTDNTSTTNNVENQVYIDDVEPFAEEVDTNYLNTYEDLIDNDIETEKIENAVNKSKMYSYNALNESLTNDGFKFKPYSINVAEEDTEHFVKINKVRFIYGSIMSLLMLLQIAVIFIILKPKNYIYAHDTALYIIALLATVSTFVFYLVPYITRKDERKSKFYNLNYHLMFGVLYLFCGLILTYAVNLIMGLNHANTLSFLSRLILPAIMLTNFVISPIVYKLVMDYKNLK